MRCYKAMCAVCRQIEIVDGYDKTHDAEPNLRELGWKKTTRLTEGDSQHWICPLHHEPGSSAVYLNIKASELLELGPGDMPGLEDD